MGGKLKNKQDIKDKSWWVKESAFLKSTRIHTWKGTFLLVFVAGLAAFFILVSANIKSVSQAAGKSASLQLWPDATTVAKGQSFNLRLVLDSGGNNVVAVRAIVDYDKSVFQLQNSDIADSIFSQNNSCAYNNGPCQAVNSDPSSGTIDFTFAKPSPGVNTPSGLLAVMSFTALQNVDANSHINIRFSSIGSYDSSAVILDDGQGTNILTDVINFPDAYVNQLVNSDTQTPTPVDYQSSGVGAAVGASGKVDLVTTTSGNSASPGRIVGVTKTVTPNTSNSGAGLNGIDAVTADAIGYYGHETSSGAVSGTANSSSDDSTSIMIAGAPSEFVNPLKFTTIGEGISLLINNLQGITVILAVLFIIIGGIMYTVSAGDEAMIRRAKATFLGAVIGLAIILAAPAFLKEISDIFALKTAYQSGLIKNAPTLRQIAGNILKFLLSVVGIIALIGLVVGGMMYMSAYGDEDRVARGKKILLYSIIGTIIAFGAMIMVNQVATLLH